MEENSTMNRRKFLKTAGIATGALVVACGGLGYVATIPPQIDFVEKHYEGKPKMKKVLVAYASKAGSTSEVAAAIGEFLSKNGADVTLEQIKNVQDLSAYQAVVVGSLIRMGSWVPAAKKFIETNKDTLGKVPTAIFTTCGTLKDDNADTRKEVADYVTPILQIVKPVDSALFAGKIDFNTMNFLDRLIMEKMIKSPQGDYRDWDAIKTWAASLVPVML